MYDRAMKLTRGLPLVIVTIALVTACAGEEELHSAPPCFEGQHQECKGDDDSVRCACVEDDGGTGSDGSDARVPADMDASDGS